MHLAGHIHRHPKLVTYPLPYRQLVAAWEPGHGPWSESRGQQAATYGVNIRLRADTGLSDTGEIGEPMADGFLSRALLKHLKHPKVQPL